MNIILFANGTSENHGCEAITRSTVKMLEDKYDKIYCSTTHLEYEKPLPLNCEWVEYSYFRKPTLMNRAVSKAERVLFKHNKFAESKPWLENIFKAYDECQIAISAGGDNYCNGSYEWLYMLHSEAKKRGLKTILWGASVNEESITNKEMQKDLLKYDVICARETLTYDIVSKFHPNVKLYPDPAFILDIENLPWPSYDNDDIPNFIGFNASPTTIACESQRGILLENYCIAIEYILENTDYHIALIPHVIYQKRYGDYEVLNKIYDKYKRTNRIILIEDNNCSVLKGYISRCKLFITARTHASIAAYSTCVPTIVLGYSQKARGIAKDLFGSEEHYVLPVQKIQNKTALTREVKWLMDNETNIRNHLQDIMPGYIKQSYMEKEVLESLN